MTLYSHLPIHFIHQPTQLRDHLPALLNASELGIDCESDSFYSYHEKVCFLQISTIEALYILDCLKFSSLTELKPLFSNPNVPKYIHGADFDIISLNRDYHLSIYGLFDTMVASQVLNCTAVGLGAQVKNYFGVNLDKSLTTSPWHQRPISAEMQDYLVNDIRYLIPLGRLLRSHLERRGSLPLAEEEFLDVEQKRWKKKEFNPGDFIQVKGANRLSFKQQKFLFQLYGMREQVAQESNQAAHWILNSRQLLEMATLDLETEADLRKLSFSCPKRVRSKVITASQETKKMPADWEAPPKTPKEPEQLTSFLNAEKQARFQSLKAWRDAKSQEYNLLPWMVSSNKTLFLIVKHFPRNLKQLSSIQHFHGFRLTLFGKELLEKLHSHSK
ncbi:MAG: HRDC domain-containing protein [Planctomycetota bacterium]